MEKKHWKKKKEYILIVKKEEQMKTPVSDREECALTKY